MTDINELPDMLSVGQVCKLLGIHENTVRNWEKNGQITAVRIGARKDRRFVKSEILKLINK